MLKMSKLVRTTIQPDVLMAQEVEAMIERGIHKGSVVPLYHQLRDILREQINNRTFKPHQQIPSEPELQRLYGLSRATIRKAIDGLVREGLIYRLHGKGTFVADPRDRQSIVLDSFTKKHAFVRFYTIYNCLGKLLAHRGGNGAAPKIGA